MSILENPGKLDCSVLVDMIPRQERGTRWSQEYCRVRVRRSGKGGRTAWGNGSQAAV